MNKIIKAELINLNIKAKTKIEAIKELTDSLDKDGRLSNVDEYIDEVLEREEISTTGIGYGIGIPHGKCDAVKVPSLVIGRSKEGVEWEALDGELVNMIFMIAVPKIASSNQHLRILAALSRKIMNDNYRKQLLEVETAQEVLDLLEEVIKALEDI